MKLAIITDSSAFLEDELRSRNDLYILDIPVTIDGRTYIEGQDLTISEFYAKMAAVSELPKTSQPSLVALEALMGSLQAQDYTHVLGLFLSSGISGFWQNIQYLADEFPDLEVAFPDTKITSAPLGMLIKQVFAYSETGADFAALLEHLNSLINKTKAFIMVDDLDHLVKGGRLSNGAALLGNLLKIKPILYFNNGLIEVFEKVRTEKKAVRRLMDILEEETADGTYQIAVIHADCEDKALALKALVTENGIADDIPIVPFGAVIGTHLGAGAVAFGLSPLS